MSVSDLASECCECDRMVPLPAVSLPHRLCSWGPELWLPRLLLLQMSGCTFGGSTLCVMLPRDEREAAVPAPAAGVAAAQLEAPVRSGSLGQEAVFSARSLDRDSMGQQGLHQLGSQGQAAAQLLGPKGQDTPQRQGGQDRDAWHLPPPHALEASPFLQPAASPHAHISCPAPVWPVQRQQQQQQEQQALWQVALAQQLQLAPAPQAGLRAAVPQQAAGQLVAPQQALPPQAEVLPQAAAVPQEAPAQPAAPEYSLLVCNLGELMTVGQLQHYFQERYPSVSSATLAVYPRTGDPKGYGFVRFTRWVCLWPLCGLPVWTSVL